jgi:hypothetical protein
MEHGKRVVPLARTYAEMRETFRSHQRKKDAQASSILDRNCTLAPERARVRLCAVLINAASALLASHHRIGTRGKDGCPCQFNALPTHGYCQAVVGYEIDRGTLGIPDSRGYAPFTWPSGRERYQHRPRIDSDGTA